MDQAKLRQRIEKHKFANIISQNTARQIMESGMRFWQQYLHGMCTRVNLSLRQWTRFIYVLDSSNSSSFTF